MSALLLAPLLLAAASSSDDVCLGMPPGGWVESSGSSGDSSGSSGNRRELASSSSGSGGDAPEEHCLVQPVYGPGESVAKLFHKDAPKEDSAFFGPGAYINKLVGAYLNTAEYKEGVPNDYLCRVADMDSMEEGGLRHLIATQWVPRAQNKCFDLTGRYDEEWFNEDYALIKDATDDGDKAWKKWKNDYTKHLCVNICPYIGSGKRACAFSQECGGHSVPEPKKRNMMQWHVLCIAIGAPLRRPTACPASRTARPTDRRPPARPTDRPTDRPPARPTAWAGPMWAHIPEKSQKFLGNS